MIILGVDWGEAKIGVAISAGNLAVPLAVFTPESFAAGISKIIEDKRVEKIVVGVSENESEDKAREFGKKLQGKVNVPVEFSDETLSTYEAQYMAIEAGVPQKKRREMEDAYAAALILQNYLDSQN